MFQRYGPLALIAIAAWDWSTAAGTRFISDRSDWAVLMAAITTFMWIYGTKIIVAKPGIGPWLIAGAALGTFLGIRWP